MSQVCCRPVPTRSCCGIPFVCWSSALSGCAPRLPGSPPPSCIQFRPERGGEGFETGPARPRGPGIQAIPPNQVSQCMVLRAWRKIEAEMGWSSIISGLAAVVARGVNPAGWTCSQPAAPFGCCPGAWGSRFHASFLGPDWVGLPSWVPCPCLHLLAAARRAFVVWFLFGARQAFRLLALASASTQCCISNLLCALVQAFFDTHLLPQLIFALNATPLNMCSSSD